MKTTVIKDPNDDIKYSVDWTGLLGTDTIATSTWTVTGLTVGNKTNTTTATTAQFSGGTINKVYKVKNSITTSQGQTMDKTFFISVETRY